MHPITSASTKQIQQSDGGCRYAKIDFSWDPAGLIDVVARFVAIPDVTLGLSSDSIDETVLAAFMLLVLLTAAQAGLTIYSVFHGYRQTSSIWTTIQASHRCQTLASMGLCCNAFILAFLLATQQDRCLHRKCVIVSIGMCCPQAYLHD